MDTVARTAPPSWLRHLVHGLRPRAPHGGNAVHCARTSATRRSTAAVLCPSGRSASHAAATPSWLVSHTASERSVRQPPEARLVLCRGPQTWGAPVTPPLLRGPSSAPQGQRRLLLPFRPGSGMASGLHGPSPFRGRRLLLTRADLKATLVSKLIFATRRPHSD